LSIRQAAANTQTCSDNCKVLECASLLAPWATLIIKSASGLAHSRTLSRLTVFFIQRSAFDVPIIK
jgi:hypothetical protein